LRVALVLATPGTTWGGMEKHVAELSETLTSLGHQVHVLAHPAYQPRFPTACFHPCPMNLGRRNPWLTWRITRTLKQISPDTAHAHGNKAASLLGRFRVGSWQTVGTAHGSKSNLRAFATLDKVIAVSRSIYEQIDHPRRYLVYNGANQEAAIGPPESHDFSAGLNVIAAGRLEPVKGFDKLIRSWPTLLASTPKPHLTIFGDGSEMERLKALIRDSGVQNFVTLAGYRNDLSDCIRHADLLVISSKREGFPYVLVESLLSECPVVSTPVSGCIELLPDNALASGFSTEAIGELVGNALSDLDTLRASEQQAFTFARENLTLDAMAKATVEVYTSSL